MSPPLWALSLPTGTVFVFVPRVISWALQVKSGVPLSNVNPREQVESKDVAAKDTHGYVRRAYAAHQNSWEAMILWSVAVLFAKSTGVDAGVMNKNAAVWLAARFVYTPAYVMIRSNTKAFFRTFIFMIGTSCSMRLMWQAALKA
ncbi:conserved unknown protein [Ectocarpus siliculosus]|uniref:Uncharacterized protein n=1 Tax=Ectocarpus siliculosus TaxID=2880 RepID=D8LDF0_ECTSI|nr:conserved unknown protein [Ectocarpus siliculosus]|eukprot:CBN74015.1 conserved unknown protein [Ectocarpus siliculosus]